MEITDLYNLLLTCNLPVAYDHFTTDNIEPPFIVYRNDEVDAFQADDYNYSYTNSYEIVLVTDKKDPNKESLIENLLNNNHIPFEKNEMFIDSERIYQITYLI